MPLKHILSADTPSCQKRAIILPAHFYGAVAGLTALLSLSLGVPVIVEFMQTGLVPRIPTAILASSLGMIAFVIFTTGIILEAIARNRIEQRKLFFLASGYKE